MAALDTNVLVCLLIDDAAAQLAAARELVRRCLDDGDALFVPVTVTLELEWVLRSAFAFDKASVAQLLSQLLSSVELSFQSERAVEVGLALYVRGAAGFSDCLHAALATASGEHPLWTFDRNAAKVEGAQLIAV